MYVTELWKSTPLCHNAGKSRPTYLLVYANIIFLFDVKILDKKLFLLLRNQAMKSKKKFLIGEVLELNSYVNIKVHIKSQTI